MWCVYCTQEVKDEKDHAPCQKEVWLAMCDEFTRVKLAFQKQRDPDAHKGETVEVRNFNPELVQE
jgi:hypothetical protein